MGEPYRRGDRLYDEVQVLPLCRAVRPEAHVYLFGLAQPFDDSCGQAKERAEFAGRGVVKVSHADDVLARSDDQCPEVQRADGVVDRPTGRLVDNPSRQVLPSGQKIASQAAMPVHGLQSSRRGRQRHAFYAGSPTAANASARKARVRANERWSAAAW